MKIFLVYPFINSPQITGYNYGLGYIAALLKKAGHRVSYFSLRDEKDFQGLFEKIKAGRPGIIAFSSTTSQFAYIKEMTGKIRKISDAFIVCGGVHPTLKPGCIYEIPELDAIVRGEGEYPMLELAEALENKESWFRIRNFWFRKDGRILKNDVRPLIKNLDVLPFPDKSSIDYQKVIDGMGGINSYIFSRGCPFTCSYCSNKALSGIYPDRENYFRQRSPEKAIEEIVRDSKKFRFSYVKFDDDSMSINREWFFEFFSMYRKHFRYPFLCNVRAGTVDAEMMRLLKDAGIDRIAIGVEQGSEDFRRKVLKRDMTNRQITDIFELAGKMHIKRAAFLMVGLPYENEKLFRQTVQLMRRINAEGWMVIYHPYPGTELGRLCEKNGWLPDRDFFREREQAVISYPGFSAEEIQLCYDMYPHLMQYRFIPLFLPLELTRHMIPPLKMLDKFFSKAPFAYRFSRFLLDGLLFFPGFLRDL